MLRILMAAPQAVSGPMPKIADLLAAGLRTHACEVTIVPWGGGGGRALLARVVDRIREVVRVRRAVSELRPDVLLVQTSFDWVCVTRDLVLTLTVGRRGRRIVLQLHGSRADVLVAPGHLLFKLASRLLLARVDAVLVLSSEEQRAFSKFRPGGTVRVVTNPFLPPPPPTAPASQNGDRLPVVLFASRLIAQKGILDTVDAFARLRERMPVRLVVAGDGPAAADVDRVVRERGLADDVTLAGRLSAEALAVSYRDADVFVLPTYHPEGFPTVISEAMSAGLPVVTSKLRGNADHLVEGKNALFVPPRDPDALAEALERVLSDQHLRERMARANRQKVKEFAPERVARGYVEVLEELLSLPDPGGAPRTAVTKDSLGDAARHAFELGVDLDWRSFDPYDLLLSPLGRAVQARSWFGARLVVQAGRHSGARLRRLLRVPPHEEAKALAEFLRAAVLLTRAGAGWAEEHAPELAARLLETSVATPTGRGWGLGFPYASRFVNVERGLPNLYVTVVASEALLDYHALTGDAAALRSVEEGCGFILDGLGFFEHRGRSWLRYWVDTESPIVNVQASAAKLLARAAAATGRARFAEAADAAAAAALAAQREDGSWPYSDDGRADLVDGFHTGFTLQGLVEYAAARGGNATAGVHDGVARGFTYFVRHLMTSAGLPRAAADGDVSLDGQNVSQCIQTLVVCDSGPKSRAAALRLWQVVLAELLRGGGRFPALRWNVAPAVLATAYLVSSSNTSA